MDNALLVGLSRQLTLRRALDVTANNLANLSTTGFKLERPALAVEQERPARHQDGPKPISFVDTWAVVRDFREGRLEATARPLDVAIRGEGFFQVRRGDETLYTRDGRFSLDEAGRLVTAAGDAVLDDAGGEITLGEGGAQATINADGSLVVDGAPRGQLGVVGFDDLSQLEKTGDGLFRAPAPGVPVETPDLRQGFVESSNVEPIVEITSMIETQRAYESVTRMIQSEEELKRRAVDKLGRLS